MSSTPLSPDTPERIYTAQDFYRMSDDHAVASFTTESAGEDRAMFISSAKMFQQIARAYEALAAYNAAADKFIGKVEHGQAHSVTTYRELKEARALAASIAS